MTITKKTVTAFSDRYPELPTDPKKFMAYWQEKLDLVPEEFRDTTYIEVEVEDYGSGAWIEVNITYQQPYTPEEVQARLTAAELLEQSHRDKDIKLFEELKIKLGR